MSARKQAVQDMMPELKKNHKSFIAFRRELNPVMRQLVTEQVKAQQEISQLFSVPSRANSQLVARCFFAKGTIVYDNYDKYYKK